VSQEKMWYFGGETSWNLKITGIWVILCGCEMWYGTRQENIHHKHLKRSL